ncbi:MAG: D-glycero-beta-D-manno-heptose-7-phosphate kinase [Mucispirillum sp.]|uniref:Bifunctional protein HldE n=1 Tax=Candidatus Mucispirillum faecigallinarum TaxID=2838699 RepID=A0A9D2GTT5_9BACT|nr:D-glycero-beta-D-manno-heptose-7-phosphate kinase [Mucispirillum sp.]HIZ89878.1 D-glycero-beta-D-manno-heptose-7-phosphate kinase [Candidatus Mucispirillum faecigallinarum]
MNKLLSDLDFSQAKVLIAGDMMLDRYYYGTVSRISPEAPVPVVNVKSEIYTLGGAGNVVNNIKGLSAQCTIIGAAKKDDDAGRLLNNLFTNIQAKSFFIDADMPTISKLRVIGSKQQIVRLDFEDIHVFSESVNNQIKSIFDAELVNHNIVVISDYGKGLCSPEICSHIIEQSNKQNKKVIIDPKGSNWDKYNNAYLVTPNVKELSEVCGFEIENKDDEVIKYGSIIREKYNLTYLIVTRSEKGITIIGENHIKTIPTQAMEVFDVSGAGDTVISSIAVFLGLNLNIDDAVYLANAAAGVVVGKLGTAPITLSELHYALSGFRSSKVVAYNHIADIIKREKSFNKTIVFTNGCFDILHRGHVTYLKHAKALGDILVLGLNSDASVKRLKGPSRPVNNEQDRAVVLEALECIDYIVIFEEDTPLNLIKNVMPDILVKGGDYKAEDVVGKEYAGRVEIIDFVEGYSTTSTINKLK